jgi:DNA-binding MurR/RpiR family transcriptional regulator
MAIRAAEKLTPRQQKALLALLNEPTVLKAAQASGVGGRTLHRWIREPEFKRAYRESFSQTVALLHRYGPLAVATLAGVTQAKDAPHAAKVAASSAMLKHGRESIELDDLAQRVEAIEQAQRAGRT